MTTLNQYFCHMQFFNEQRTMTNIVYPFFNEARITKSDLQSEDMQITVA